MKNLKPVKLKRRPAWNASAAPLSWIAGIACCVCTASAEGFRNPPAGTFGLGRAGGKIAHVDDSSAAQHNPANLVDLLDPELHLTPTIAGLEWTFDSASAPSQKAETKDTWKLLPNLFGALPLKDQKLALGLGITTPYGMASIWDRDTSAFARPTGILRYQSPFSAQLTTINFNPSVALRLGEHVQIGAGLDVMWSDLTLKQYYPWLLATGNFADPDGVAKAAGDGVGYGGNVGVTFKFLERHRVAFTYRSPISIDHTGNFSVSRVPAAFGGGTLRSDFETEVGFPTIVAAGYGFQLTDTIRLGADVEWLEFSNFDKLPIRVKSGPPGLPTVAPQNWKDTFTVGIAGDWQFLPDWTFRLGYQFYESPIPDSTFTPMLVDANQNVVTTGLKYRRGRHDFELAYSEVFYDSRSIRSSYNPAFNGDYEVTLHLISLGYRFRF